MATLNKFENDVYYVEITGVGENISNRTERIYFSKSGADLVKNCNENLDCILEKTELYINSKGKGILTRKKDTKTITFSGNIESSYRGTSGVKETNGIVVSATGAGRLGEHTEFVASLKDGEYLIMFFDGRYKRGYIGYLNKGGKLIIEEVTNNEKYGDMPDLEEIKVALGVVDICNVVEKKDFSTIKDILPNAKIIEEDCDYIKIKINNHILTITNIEKGVKND